MLWGGVEQGRGMGAGEEGELGVVILVMWSWKALLSRGQLSKCDDLGPSLAPQHRASFPCRCLGFCKLKAM